MENRLKKYNKILRENTISEEEYRRQLRKLMHEEDEL